MGIVKDLSKWQLPGLMLIASILLIYLAFFSNIPAETNSWSPTLRTSTHWLLFTIGLIFAIVAVSLTVISTKTKHSVQESQQNKMTPTVITGEKLEATQSHDVDDPLEHPLVQSYWKLRQTQKEIALFLYEDTIKDRLTLDQFYEKFREKHGPKVLPSTDELYYRLKVLEHQGFIKLEGIAPRITDVVKIKEVRIALRDGEVIKTAD